MARKSSSILLLETMAMDAAKVRYPAAASRGALAPRKYTDRTANGLTRCITDFLQLNGWQAERIAVQGRCIDKTEVVTDVLGGRKRIGSVSWIPGQMTPGSADISATIRGRSVKIEVKIGSDRQSEAQRKYQEAIERAGGTYVIARSFDQFIEWYNDFL